MQKASTSYVERIVRNVCANMKSEGFHTSEVTRKECYAVASGTRSADEIIKAYVQAYRKES